MQRISVPEMQPFEQEGMDAVRRAAPECMVLLRNDRCVLPLQSPKRIALYGSGARHTVKGGTGSGDVNVRHFVTVEEGLRHAGVEITTAAWLAAYDDIRTQVQADFAAQLQREAKEQGVDPVFYAMWRTPPEPDYEIPLTAAGDAAVYVLARSSGEGVDRCDEAGDVRLTETEVRDIRALNSAFEDFVLVLNVGGVVDLAPVAEVATVLLMSQLGSAAEDAVADVLLGTSYPSGKLTTTWAAVSDSPSTAGFSAPDDTYYREGIYVGYRYFDIAAVTPRYRFGFGLGYTEFAVENTAVRVRGDEICVQVNVRNVGASAGKEVVQLYVSAPDGVPDQPYQELRGYAKTRELHARESEMLEITVRASDLSSFDETQSAYVFAAGTYWLRIGTSSDAANIVAGLRLERSVTVERVRAICTGGSTDGGRSCAAGVRGGCSGKGCCSHHFARCVCHRRGNAYLQHRTARCPNLRQYLVA